MRVQQHDIAVQSIGRLLQGSLFVPEDAQKGSPAVVFAHGLGSSMLGYAHRAKVLTETLGTTALIFDLSGHGEDPPKYSEYTPGQHLQDLIAAIDLVQGLPHVDAMRLGICGASYGACLAVLATSERRIARLLLRAPAILADEDLDQPLEMRTRGNEPKAAPKFLQQFGAYNGACMVVESEFDEEIPTSAIRAYLNMNRHVSYFLIPGATHALTDPEWDRIFVAKLIEWFTPL